MTFEHHEPPGAETLFHVKTNAHSIISRTAGMQPPPTGPVALVVDVSRLHLFDPGTGPRIS